MTTREARPTHPGTAPSALQIRIDRNILDFISQRGMEAGSHLVEQDLADEFRVSRSPVRAALTFLVAKGFVEQRARRGFFVCRDGRDLRPESLDLPQTADEKMCVRVAKDWFEKRVPRSFTEADFRRRYGLGRLAASRILLVLSEQGIVTRNKGHGWQFEPTLNTREAHDESYAFRMALEPAAILCPTFELDRALAKVSRRRHAAVLTIDADETALGTLFDIDAEFHQLICISSGNRFFRAAIDRQNALRRLVEYESLLDHRGRLVASCAEHMAILDAIEAGDRERAAELMREHLRVASRFGPDYTGRRRRSAR